MSEWVVWKVGGLFVLCCCVGLVSLWLCGLIYTVEWARVCIILPGLYGDDSAICYRVRRDFETFPTAVVYR